MEALIFIIFILSLVYFVEQRYEKKPVVDEQKYLFKEISLIESFYANPRIKVTKDVSYTVLDEQSTIKFAEDRTVMYFCLIKDDEDKLSWVDVSYFKLVEDAEYI